jgi:hypothetical protein
MIRLHRAHLERGPPPDDLQRELDDDDLPKARRGGARHLLALDLEPLRPLKLAVLEADVASRTRRLVPGGLAARLENLHDDVRMSAESIDVLAAPPASEHRLPSSGAPPGAVGLHLAGPRARPRPHREPQHHLWGTRHRRALARRGAGNPGRRLASLLWRILRAGEVGVCTTDLARKWDQSPSAVSVVEACRRQTDPAGPGGTYAIT